MTIDEFIAEHGVSMTSEYLGRDIDDRNWEHYAWRCRLKADGRRMQVTFRMGTAHEGKEPGLDEVLDSLASDASILDEYQDDFEGFGAMMGYETFEDYPRAKRDFEQLKKQTRSFKRLLGDEAVETLMYDVERL